MDAIVSNPLTSAKVSEGERGVNDRTSLLPARICGLAALILGGTVLSGWAFNILALAQFRSGQVPMVVNTAIGFVLAGIALIFAGLNRRGIAAAIPTLLGCAIILLAGFALCETIFDFSSPLDMAALHKKLQPMNIHPGQLAPNTAVAFLCFGLALILYRRVKGPRLATLIRILTFAIFILGLLGVMGYWIRLESLYNWTNTVGMAENTAAGGIIMAVGLWTLWRGLPWNKIPAERLEVERIYRLSVGILIVTVLFAGISSFSIMQHQMAGNTVGNLSRLSRERRLFFNRTIQDRTARAAIMANEPGVVGALRALQQKPDDPTILAQLRYSVRQLRHLGFSAVEYRIGDRKQRVFGRLIAHPTMQVPLAGHYLAWLIWANGYILRTQIPLKTGGLTYGDVTAEQPLQGLDRAYQEAASWGQSGTMVVCANLAGRDQCFPIRGHPAPFSVPMESDGKELPVNLAASGKSGILKMRDYRGHRVLAAFGPIGHTGLSMVLKMNLSEVYAPIREQFAIAMTIVLALILTGLWIMRRRLKPLVQLLVNSRQQARANEARFIAAANGGIDAFFIMESVRDNTGDIQNFRFVFANVNAHNLTRYSAEEFKGRLLSELFPTSHAAGLFEHYKQVAKTGRTLSEELEIHDPAVKSNWISHQVVRLGDGVAITARDITEQKRAAARIQHQALHDPLTGLANRALMEDRITRALARAGRQNEKVVIALIDLNHFKPINDQLGHHVGDKLLQTVAKRLETAVRDSDTVARLGGDEFVLVLPEVKDTQAARMIAQRAGEAISVPVYIEDKPLRVTASVGISVYPDDGTDMETLLRNADRAMYHAKKSGSVRCEIFTAEMQESSENGKHCDQISGESADGI